MYCTSLQQSSLLRPRYWKYDKIQNKSIVDAGMMEYDTSTTGSMGSADSGVGVDAGEARCGR